MTPTGQTSSEKLREAARDLEDRAANLLATAAGIRNVAATLEQMASDIEVEEMRPFHFYPNVKRQAEEDETITLTSGEAEVPA